jgi:hypothetical protein
MRIDWEVDDGYAGPSRPQSSNIDDDEILEYDTLEEAMRFVNDCIQEDFETIEEKVKKLLEERDKDD